MFSLAGLLVFLWVCAVIGLIAFTAQNKRREQQLLYRFRRTGTYIRLYQKMAQLLATYDIDQLRIEQSGVTVTSVYPAHTLLSFDFKQNGKCKRSDLIPRMVAQLLLEDFPQLCDGEIYKTTRYSVYRANGKREDGFSITMRRRYKDLVINARTSVQLRIL